MKKSFNYFRANPGGNITGFVVWPVYPGYRKAYSDLIKEQIDSSVEQVGFISPAYEGAPLRLDMMGGEFCANATRAYGLYSASFYDVEGPCDIEVYVSGKKDVVDVIADVEKSTAYVAMDNPINTYDIEIEGKSYKTFEFDGITHLISEEKEDKNFVDKALKILKEKIKADAYGVIFFNKDDFSYIPYVYVVKTESLVRESSCGSGVVSLANYINDKIPEECNIVFKGPNGELEVITDTFDGVNKYLVGGPVEMTSPKKVSIDIPQEIVKEVTDAHNREVEKRRIKEAEEKMKEEKKSEEDEED
ncbi:hypothetical protein [Peptoniphilus raoultii]|uniref:hypothetical protein n=1 Tax=Peptoniphilus raoultii TaxID=1776387 RepID=UPI0008DA7DBD|nr:hypothetical protein [Peptoniphilus raoultii]